MSREEGSLRPGTPSDACRSFRNAKVVFDQHHMTLTWASAKKEGVWYKMGCQFNEPTKLDPYGMTVKGDWELKLAAAP